MYAARLFNPTSVVQIIPRCLRLARDFLILPDHIHRWCIAIITSLIVVLVAGFLAFAYAEKYHLVNNFFYGQLRFSFVDGGYPELFGYGLEIAACVIFAMFAWIHEKKQWYAWSAILFVTFLDDAFKMHETIGQSFTVWFGASSVEGDLIGFASTGLMSAVLWFAGIPKVSNEDDLSAYLIFTAYYTILIFFGVGVDAVHGMFGEHMSQTVFTLFEDGGELITTAAICLSAFGMLLRQKHSAVRKLEDRTSFQRAGHTVSRKTF